MEYSIKTINKILEEEFKFKKKYGQNFIFDKNTIEKIAKKANVSKDDLIIEIGPGIGSLTYILSDYVKQIIAFEIDTTLSEHLKKNLEEKTNVEIIFQDFLEADLSKYTKKNEYKNIMIVANIPYSITTPILFKIIEEENNVDKLVLMMQKEVGARISAKPKTKDYNALSVMMDYYFEVKKIMDVSRNVFYPVPNVDSIVIELVKKEKKEDRDFEKKLIKLVKDSFKQKRKTIKNNLREYDLEKIAKILEKNNFNLSTRAEEIPADVFIQLTKELSD